MSSLSRGIVREEWNATLAVRACLRDWLLVKRRRSFNTRTSRVDEWLERPCCTVEVPGWISLPDASFYRTENLHPRQERPTQKQWITLRSCWLLHSTSHAQLKTHRTSLWQLFQLHLEGKNAHGAWIWCITTSGRTFPKDVYPIPSHIMFAVLLIYYSSCDMLLITCNQREDNEEHAMEKASMSRFSSKEAWSEIATAPRPFHHSLIRHMWYCLVCETSKHCGKCQVTPSIVVTQSQWYLHLAW